MLFGFPESLMYFLKEGPDCEETRVSEPSPVGMLTECFRVLKNV